MRRKTLAFQSSAGFEIREDGASAVLLKTSIGGSRIAAKESFVFGAELPKEEKAKAAADFLRSFLKRNGGSSAAVYVVVPRQWALNRIVTAPAVVKESLREALGYEMDKYIPFSAESVWYDYDIISEDQEQIRVLLTAIKKEFVLSFFETPGGIGKTASGLETLPTALVNGVLDLNIPRDGHLSLLYQRNGRIEISLLQEGRLVLSRSVETSRNSEKLEGLLLTELRKAYEAAKIPKEGMISLCVAGESVSGALAALKAKGEIAELNDASEISKVIESDMLPAYGAALKGLKKVRLDTNLLPNEFRRKASRAPLYILYLMVFFVLAASAAWGVGHIIKQRAELNSLSLQAKALSSEAEAVQKIRGEIVALEARIKYLEDFRARRGALILLIKELTERIPKGAWISNLNFSEKGVEIEGYADSASELIPLLDKSPMFKDVGFLSSITKAQGKERFRIGLKQVRDADDKGG